MSRTGLYLTSGLTLEKVIWRGKKEMKQQQQQQTSKQKKQTNKIKAMKTLKTCGPKGRLFIYHYH